MTSWQGESKTKGRRMATAGQVRVECPVCEVEVEVPVVVEKVIRTKIDADKDGAPQVIQWGAVHLKVEMPAGDLPAGHEACFELDESDRSALLWAGLPTEGD